MTTNAPDFSSMNKRMLVNTYLYGVEALLFPDSEALTRRPVEALKRFFEDLSDEETLKGTLKTISLELKSRGIDITHL